LNAIELLRQARASAPEIENETVEESREIELESDELLAIGASGAQEGSPVEVVVSGLLQGGTIQIQTVTPIGMSNVKKEVPEKAPIVRMNPSPYPG